MKKKIKRKKTKKVKKNKRNKSKLGIFILLIGIVISVNKYEVIDISKLIGDNGGKFWSYTGDERLSFENDDEIETVKAKIEIVNGEINIGKSDKNLITTSQPKLLMNNELETSGTSRTYKSAIYKNYRDYLRKISFDGYNYCYKFNPDIDLDIETYAVIADGKFDFSDMSIDTSVIGIVLGDIKLEVNKKTNIDNIVIASSSSNIKIISDSERGIKINLIGIIKENNLTDVGFEKIDGEYYSKNYKESVLKTNVNIFIGIGSVIVKYEEEEGV